MSGSTVYERLVLEVLFQLLYVFINLTEIFHITCVQYNLSYGNLEFSSALYNNRWSHYSYFVFISEF